MMKRFLALILLGCILLSLAACGSEAVTGQPAPAPGQVTDSTPPDTDPAPLAENTLRGIRLASSYAEVFSQLRDLRGNSGTTGGLVFDGMEEAVPEAAPAPEADVPTGGMNDSSHSQTNVQVSGIDEGDIVKTNGELICVLRAGELIIFKADGRETVPLSRLRLGESVWEETADPDGGYKGSYSRERQMQELYLAEDRLAVIYSYYYWSDRYDPATGGYVYENENRVGAMIYDISDPTAPSLLADLSQDGSYTASRMVDGKLYLISRHWVPGEMEEAVPESYVPRLYSGQNAEPIACDCIWLPEEPRRSSYTVLTQLELQDASRAAELSILGGSDTVYMDHNDLYLAESRGNETVSAPRQDGVYTVKDYSYETTTTITRVSLADGLTVAANGSVKGSLLNQFSMDSHRGYLRLVTTSSGHSYTIYEDERMGFVNYVWPDETRKDTNNLFVLDGGLNLVGSITGLAEDERVYSVRFDGDIGYFVTFRQTDPLFAVDLSEPTAPKLLSALKIPGFSQYLHVYGEGRLFGLGMDADEETGWTECMKLSMFDTTDPTDVREKHTLRLDDIYWSEALYNHKAILIAPDKDIIAFPAENGYLVYGYSDAQGFYLRAEIADEQDGGWWLGNARGLYIGQYAYVVGESQIWVLDLDSLLLAETIEF